MSNVRVEWPNVDEFIVTPDRAYIDVHNLLARCIERTSAALKANRKPRHVLFNSKFGLGKTLLVATMAVELRKRQGREVPLITFDCSESTAEHHLKGSFTVQPDGSTAFVPGPIPLALELANRTGFSILCLEEMSALTPGAQKVVNSITDWRNGVYVSQIGKNIRLQPGAQLLVTGTMNPTAHGGVYGLNPDLRSRFVEEVVPWPDMIQETNILKEVCSFVSGDVIQSAVQLARDSRAPNFDTNLSTRCLVTLLEDLHDLPNMKENVLLCVANKFEGTERDTIVDRIDALFKTKVKKLIAA